MELLSSSISRNGKEYLRVHAPAAASARVSVIELRPAAGSDSREQLVDTSLHMGRRRRRSSLIDAKNDLKRHARPGLRGRKRALGYGIECTRTPHCVSVSSLFKLTMRARLRTLLSLRQSTGRLTVASPEPCFPDLGCITKRFQPQLSWQSTSLATGSVFHQLGDAGGGWRRREVQSKIFRGTPDSLSC